MSYKNNLKPGLGLGSESLPGTVCAFSPDSEIELQSHSLYLTDDLFAPHVESCYRYPAYTIVKKIVFLKQKLEDSAFIRQLGWFWERWVSRRKWGFVIVI